MTDTLADPADFVSIDEADARDLIEIAEYIATQRDGYVPETIRVEAHRLASLNAAGALFKDKNEYDYIARRHAVTQKIRQRIKDANGEPVRVFTDEDLAAAFAPEESDLTRRYGIDSWPDDLAREWGADR